MDEYGSARISGGFARASGSSKEKLDVVLSDFSAFTAGAEIKDDLTVIVLTYVG